MIVNQIKIAEDKQEELQRVSPGFPVSVYQTDFSLLDDRRVDWHWHEDFQLCWVTKGSVRFRVVNLIRQVSAGNGIFINRKLVHTSEPDAPESAYYCVDFHPDLICPNHRTALREKVLSPLADSDRPPCFLLDCLQPEGAHLMDAIRRIVRLSESRDVPGWELLLHGELLRLWPVLLTFSPRGSAQVSARSNQRIQTMMAYLKEHYQEKISLRDVAGEVFLCPEECARLFKRITGKTIFQYLMQYRIEKSQELLGSTGMSIAEIAAQTGFSSQSYFAVCFQKQTGYTPGQYKRERMNRFQRESRSEY